MLVLITEDMVLLLEEVFQKVGRNQKGVGPACSQKVVCDFLLMNESTCCDGSLEGSEKYFGSGGRVVKHAFELLDVVCHLEHRFIGDLANHFAGLGALDGDDRAVGQLVNAEVEVAGVLLHLFVQPLNSFFQIAAHLCRVVTDLGLWWHFDICRRHSGFDMLCCSGHGTVCALRHARGERVGDLGAHGVSFSWACWLKPSRASCARTSNGGCRKRYRPQVCQLEGVSKKKRQIFAASCLSIQAYMENHL